MITGITILFALLISATSIDAVAQPVGGKWWKVPEYRDSLELTQEQVSHIDFIFASYENKLRELHENLKKQQFVLRNRIRNPHSSSAQIRSATEIVESTKASYKRTSLEMYLRIRDALTPQQRMSLQDMSHASVNKKHRKKSHSRYK